MIHSPELELRFAWIEELTQERMAAYLYEGFYGDLWTRDSLDRLLGKGGRP